MSPSPVWDPAGQTQTVNRFDQKYFTGILKYFNHQNHQIITLMSSIFPIWYKHVSLNLNHSLTLQPFNDNRLFKELVFLWYFNRFYGGKWTWCYTWASQNVHYPLLLAAISHTFNGFFAIKSLEKRLQAITTRRVALLTLRWNWDQSVRGQTSTGKDVGKL